MLECAILQDRLCGGGIEKHGLGSEIGIDRTFCAANV